MDQNHSIYTRGIWLIAGSLILLSMVVQVWGQSVQELTINYVEAVTVPEQFANQVRIYTTVTGDDQKPVLDLAAADFEILEDGRKVVIDDVSPATDPMAVVLAIDTSGSMQARDKSGRTSMTAATDAAVKFISMLSAGDQLALFSFNNEPILQIDFSEDHKAAIAAVNSLAAKPNAATCLYDTAFEAVQKSAEIPRGRRAIILLTDGKDEKAGRACSTHNSNDVIDIATTKSIRVPIYTIGVGPKVDARELGRIASFTGGRSLMATSLADLEGLYQTVADQLKNQYLVTYTSRTLSGEHSLVLKVLHKGTKGQDEKRFWSPPLPVSQPPNIRFLSPGTADQLKGVVRVKISIEPEGAAAKVRYYVDASLKEEDTTAPFDTFNWDTVGLPGGLHILRAEVVDINGRTGSAEMTVKIAGPPARPQPQPITAAHEKKTAAPTSIWIVGIVLLAALAGGLAYWFSRKQRPTALEASTPEETVLVDEKPTEDIEDETLFVADFGDAEPVPPASVKVVRSEALVAGKSFEVSSITRFGRGSDNDIQIPDGSVSRKHGEIYFEDGAFYIRDLGSKNGIKIDGKRILSGGATLHTGAKIQLAPKTILEFHTVALEKDAEPDDDKTKIYE